MGKTAEIFETKREKLFDRLADSLETAYNLSRKVVSFQANKVEPIYRWFKYKEGFSSTLVKYFLSEYGRKEGKVLDPFAGAGTTLFDGQELACDSYGIALLPVCAFVVKTRQALTEMDIEQLRNISKKIWTDI